MTDLLILAERCEAATGPDRELDAEIGAIPVADFLGFLVGKQPGCQAYTASLDAAMTLVPEGCFPIIDCEPEAAGVEVMRVVPDGYNSIGAVSVSLRSATPALALCAAALRARATEAAHDRG